MIVCFPEKNPKKFTAPLVGDENNTANHEQTEPGAAWGGTISLARRPRIVNAKSITESAKLRYSHPKALRVKRLISSAGGVEPCNCPENGQFFIRLIRSERGFDASNISEMIDRDLWKLPEAHMAFEDYISPEIYVPLMGCTVVSEHQVMSVDYADQKMVVLSHIRIGSRHRIDMPLCAYLNYCDQYQMIAIRGVDGQIFSGDPKSLDWRGRGDSAPSETSRIGIS